VYRKDSETRNIAVYLPPFPDSFLGRFVIGTHQTEKGNYSMQSTDLIADGVAALAEATSEVAEHMQVGS
jgi:hypothetical protein